MRRAATLLTAIVLTLVALGTVMLYSSSSAKGNEPLFFVQRQLIWLMVALVGGTLVAKFRYNYWRRLTIPLYLVTLVLLVLVFVPGIGVEVKGSYRWIGLGPARLQASEAAKFALLAGLAAWIAHFRRRMGEFRVGFLYPLILLGLALGLIFVEPDFGTTAVLGTVGMAMLFIGGTRFSYLLCTAVVGGTAFVAAIFHNEERWGRLVACYFPEKYPQEAYQAQQSIIAFVMGHWGGVGLGNSMQKRLYLPEAHTDFILSIVAEELGILASVLVLLLFVGYFICGMTISMRAREPFARLFGFGITLLVCLQAMINIGVVTGVLPTKGIALPFISYGGSSLVMSIVMTAVLLNIAQVESAEGEAQLAPRRGEGDDIA